MMNKLFDVDEDYIKRYIEKFALYYNNETLYVLNKEDYYYKKLTDIIHSGICKIELYEGDWYELKLTKDPYLFSLFIKFNNYTRAYSYNLTDTLFKMFEHNGCYTTKFLGTVKVSITEQHKWSFRDLPMEEKEKLYEFFIQHPLRDED